MNPAILGLVRGLGVVVATAVLTYFGDAAHLNGIVSVSVAGIISSLALMLEHAIEDNTGKALFGAVRAK